MSKDENDFFDKTQSKYLRRGTKDDSDSKKSERIKNVSKRYLI